MCQFEAILTPDFPGAKKNQNFRNLAIFNVLFSRANIHLSNQSVINGIHVLHHAVREQLSRHIMDDLMHLHDDAAILLGSEALWFDVRADGFELARPVIADSCVRERGRPPSRWANRRPGALPRARFRFRGG
jgi:hypothetical protein